MLCPVLLIQSMAWKAQRHHDSRLHDSNHVIWAQRWKLRSLKLPWRLAGRSFPDLFFSFIGCNHLQLRVSWRDDGDRLNSYWQTELLKHIMRKLRMPALSQLEAQRCGCVTPDAVMLCLFSQALTGRMRQTPGESEAERQMTSPQWKMGSSTHFSALLSCQ